MPKQSAGILLYRKGSKGYEILIVHPGGPFWARKDLGAWSIPKGEFIDTEDALTAAKREFAEEIGSSAPTGEYVSLGTTKQSSGKVVHAFALESDFNLEHFKSNMFEMEWPPKSGQKQEFPENDKAAWVAISVAKQRVVKGQVVIIEKLAEKLGIDLEDEPDAPRQASLSLDV
jgi:predicted NUDIX family NTP pyrophosphohydrolase